MRTKPLLTLRLKEEQDVVFARQRARQIAGALGFDTQDQTRIATAVSEIARNAYEYANGGTIAFALDDNKPRLSITVRDSGKGIADLSSVLEGGYRSETGMGLGIIGARRLMDSFDIESGTGGTAVGLSKLLPPSAPALDITKLARELAQGTPQSLLDEVQRQNQELLTALEELRLRQEQLVELNRELEDTNRGVVALYAELDERADELRRANEAKTRFLSNMSHELRTPINAILGLTRLLQGEVDGSLNEEQRKQIGFISLSGESLRELVNDLLDLAKVEAGKIVVSPESFDVDALFGAMRGMLKPLVADTPVQLIFEAPPLPPLRTDEGKVAQILRNYISNAIKFTTQGEVRVTARLVAGVQPQDNAQIEFCVADTGIGIAPESLVDIWDEFSQVETPLQKRNKGTGLGLPLARKLAELLGGSVAVESEVGVGSRFLVTIPQNYQGETGDALIVESEFNRAELLSVQSDVLADASQNAPTILIIDDNDVDRYLLRQMLGNVGHFVEASGGQEGLRLALQTKPYLIFLDWDMPGMDGRQVLEKLSSTLLTREIPVVIHTSHTLSELVQRELAGRCFAIVNKDRTPENKVRLQKVMADIGLKKEFVSAQAKE